MRPVELPFMLTPEEAAEALEVRPATLARWRWSGRGPRYVKLGKAVRYRKQDVLDFIEDSVRAHTASNTQRK